MESRAAEAKPKRAAEPQHDRREDARRRGRDGDLVGGLPVRVAKRERALAQVLGHVVKCILGDRDDGRQRHDADDDAGRQRRQPRVDVEHRRDEWVKKRQPEKPEHYRRDGRHELDDRLGDFLERAARELGEVDRRGDADGDGEQKRDTGDPQRPDL